MTIDQHNTRLKEWIESLPIEHKAFCFFEKTNDKGATVGSDAIEEFGDDDRFKSNAYMITKITAKQYNRLVARTEIKATVKMWYNYKKNGYEKPNFELYSFVLDSAFKKFGKIQNASAESDLRVIKASFEIVINEYISCNELNALNVEIC